ncbi:MAG TPA: C25 family cysteine peptidase [Bacteroidales bacterium]|nr:C25 family cysteine peptidase [Bacteroidales bacterium]HPS15995.1 C25 family cysteine peptidase [Bacteroidales bacterium]
MTIIVISALCFMGLNSSAQVNRKGKNFSVEFNQVKSNVMNLLFTIDNFKITERTENGVTYSSIEFEKNGVSTNKKGYAELPIIHATVQLDPEKNVSMEVENGTYTDYNLDFPLLPSRGTITRNQDPSTIPYEIDPASLVDAWYPVDLATTVDPFIIRNVRGTSVYVYPMQYNAAKKILRVYNTINVKLTENNTTPVNPLTSISKTEVNEALDMYKNVFINFDNNKTNWSNEVGETGDILVITTSTYASAVQPYIDWKKQMGYSVTLQTVTAGTDVTTTIKNAYTANTKLFYVLLVGDYADVKSPTISYNQTTGATDPMLGCVVGTDNNIDICVGRFSVSSTTDVTTQVNKTINYEKTPTASGTWYKKSLTIGSPASNGQGDDNEYDYSHVANIYNNKLSKFTYTSNATLLESNSASNVSTAVNGGVSIANYCGHGDYNLWVSTNYSNTNVNSLTNGEKLPFIFSVACLNGNFNGSSICFAEAWLRKSGGGAVAALMSSVSQDWTEPMAGQDYLNDMVVGGHTYTNPESGTNTDHGKTHFGSIVVNGGALAYSEMSSYLGTMKTWTVFGDPALQIRTDTPKDIVLSNSIVTTDPFTTTVTVNGTPFANALVSIWDGTNQPTSALTNASGQVTITHGLTAGATAKLTVTGFNLMTSTQDVTVQSTVDIAELLDQTVSVYPNPATDNITLSIINSINGNYNIDIVDLVGKTVYSENIAKDNTIFTKQIDLSNLSKGVYLLKYNENGNVGYKKIVIN